MTATAVDTRGATHAKGVTLLLASTIAWSTAGVFVRSIPLDALSMLVWRGLAGAIGILVVLALIEGPRALLGLFHLRWIGFAYALISATAMLAYVPSLKLTTVAHVAIIYATVPFVAAGLAFALYRERPGLSALAASLVAVAGVAVMVASPESGASLAGDALAVVMTVCAAGLMVLGRHARSVPLLPAAAMSCLMGAVASVPFVTALPANVGVFGLIGLSGLVNNALGLGIFVLGARMVPAVESALIGALEAPMAPFWVWLVLSEVPSRQTMLGGALVTIAVLGHFLAQARR